MHVFLSYPKSGRTWVRFMIDDYLCRKGGLDLPDVFAVEKLSPPPHPVLWTHLTGAMLMERAYWEMGPWTPGPLADRPWLVLLRNFYATMASAYFQARDRIRKFDGPPSRFLRDPRFGVIKLATFLNLLETLRPRLARVHVFHYERIKADPGDEMRRVLEALDLVVDEDALRATVADATFERMRRLSVTPAYAGSVLAPTDPADPSTFKVRGGAGYRDLFSGEDLAYIDAVLDALLIAGDDEDVRCCRGEPAATAAAAV